MMAYYKKPSNPEYKGRRAFIYAKLEMDEVDHMLEDRIPFKRNFETTALEEVHLTTDNSFELYMEKRLCTPRLLLIADTQKHLDTIIEKYGYCLA